MGRIPSELNQQTADTLVVSEIFGPTFQGEGPNIGRLAAFVRFGGCNLTCSWCDTPYTWDATRHDLREELSRLAYQDIAARVAEVNPHLVVITGGEPLLWQGKTAWRELLAGFATRYDLEVETNGTVAPSADTAALVDHFDCSPKLANSGIDEHKRINPDALSTLADLARDGKATAKFVVEEPTDLDEAEAIVSRFSWPRNRVMVMPQGTSTDEILTRARRLAQPTLDKGFNMTTRLHVLLFGDERGT